MYSSTIEKQPCACVAVGVFESRKLSDAAVTLDKATRGRIRELLSSGDMDGKAGSTRLLYRMPGIAAGRVLLVGLGREKEFGEKQYREYVRAALSAIHIQVRAMPPCISPSSRFPRAAPRGKRFSWCLRLPTSPTGSTG